MFIHLVRFGACSFFGLLLLGPVRAAEEPSVAGTYTCVGGNGDAKYQGTVKITRKGDTYQLEWTIGRESHFGVAFITNGCLCSSWAVANADGKLIQGVVVYKIEKGKLVGKWTQHPGNGKIYDETLTLND